jgi:L-cysteate sulfo-lyase
MNLDQFPRFPLAHLPTPLEPLERLQKFLGGPRLYIKRDDCTGLATGGNKTRKLEFLIGQALKQGATAVVSAGGLQSNHVRQTAAAAARAGLKCHLVLDHRVPIDTEAYRTGGNFLLDRLLGALAHICGPGETRAGKTAQLLADLRARGENPYDIPVGGSNETGALGYVAMIGELLAQARDRGISLDRIVVGSSSGGTQAGLVTGRALAGADIAITGIDVDGEPETLRAKMQTIARDCAGRLGRPQAIGPDACRIVPGYSAPGYGQPNAGMIEALKLLASLEGILLDPVYTGKAMAGLIDMIRKGQIEKNETVVFVHTGGTPALSAYADRL